MTPTARIVGLLSDNVDHLEDILTDNICAYMIDEENVDNTNPILVVSEDNDGQRDMGNNTILSTIKRISTLMEIWTQLRNQLSPFYTPTESDDISMQDM